MTATQSISPNEPGAANPATAAQFDRQPHSRGVADPGRLATNDGAL